MKNSRRTSEDKHDPLAEELNFNELEVVRRGPGWKKTAARLQNPKSLREARTKLGGKPTPSKLRGRRVA